MAISQFLICCSACLFVSVFSGCSPGFSTERFYLNQIPENLREPIANECYRELRVQKALTVPVLTELMVNKQCLKIIHTSRYLPLGCILPSECGTAKYQVVDTGWLGFETAVCYSDSLFAVGYENVTVYDFDFFENGTSCDLLGVKNYYYLMHRNSKYSIISHYCITDAHALLKTVKTEKLSFVKNADDTLTVKFSDPLPSVHVCPFFTEYDKVSDFFANSPFLMYRKGIHSDHCIYDGSRPDECDDQVTYSVLTRIDDDDEPWATTIYEPYVNAIFRCTNDMPHAGGQTMSELKFDLIELYFPIAQIFKTILELAFEEFFEIWAFSMHKLMDPILGLMFRTFSLLFSMFLDLADRLKITDNLILYPFVYFYFSDHTKAILFSILLFLLRLMFLSY
jgi:hypothetical protein